ncbi:ATP-binding protein [Deinococcus arenicola]|uniref:ATP-binding protein n=1 Tax=Deinococcus arenicola TaxID=2994950 RepID=A0ABU4DP74_9DEIO|nr:ATP-binding protein [Deinococcus sp. ZS9-10]MDV6374173.1 ATP-binding protein [Deinococcus sp. ZS9-10]
MIKRMGSQNSVNLDHNQFSVLRGATIRANYTETPIYQFKGKPFIEALHSPEDMNDIINALKVSPVYHDTDRELSVLTRLEMIQNVRRFVQPVDVHLTLAMAFIRTLKWGYVDRDANGTKRLGSVSAPLDKLPKELLDIAGDTGEGSFLLIGTPGIGKTLCIKKILNMFPQVIVHSSYAGKSFKTSQVVWIKLDCPSNASIKGFCQSFLRIAEEILDIDIIKTMTTSRTSVDDLKPLLKYYAAQMNLGVLVIDEIQNFDSKRAMGEDNLLAFLVEIINTIGVPVILIGNFSIYSTIEKQFRLIRKTSGQGVFIWNSMDNDTIWHKFCKKMWQYQYTKEHTEFTEEFGNVLHQISHGIPDIAAKAYMLAQSSVIISKDQIKLTPKLLITTARKSMGATDKVLNLLSKPNLTRAERAILADVRISDESVKAIIDSEAEQMKVRDLKDEGKLFLSNEVLASLINNIKARGYTDDQASNASHYVIEKYGSNCDANLLYGYALSHLSQSSQQRDGVILPKRKGRKRMKSNAIDQILEDSKDSDRPNHEILRELGIIKDISDILGDDH